MHAKAPQNVQIHLKNEHFQKNQKSVNLEKHIKIDRNICQNVQNWPKNVQIYRQNAKFEKMKVSKTSENVEKNI